MIVAAKYYFWILQKIINVLSPRIFVQMPHRIFYVIYMSYKEFVPYAAARYYNTTIFTCSGLSSGVSRFLSIMLDRQYDLVNCRLSEYIYIYIFNKKYMYL